MLTQVDDQGEEHPVAFASRKLLPRERRYAAVEKECLAVVEGFRVYLEGKLITGHWNTETVMAKWKCGWTLSRKFCPLLSKHLVWYV